MPPCFWATAAGAAVSAISNPAATAKLLRCRVICRFLPSVVACQLGRTASMLFVEPNVLEAPAVVVSIDHHCVPLELGLPASSRAGIEDDRPRGILRQSPFDLPNQLLAFFIVGLHRLLVDQFVDLGIAITGVVTLGAAHEILV